MVSEARCFTFLWKLENIRFYLQEKGERIESPAFMVDAIAGTKWKLQLYPPGASNENCISFYLHREEGGKVRASVEIKYELACIRKDCIVLASNGIIKRTFSEGETFGVDIAMQDVFVNKRSLFLPHDTPTLRCRIWKSLGEMTEDVQCTILTRIGFEKKSLEWKVKNFSNLESEEKLSYQLKSIPNDLPLMSIDLSLTAGLNSEEILLFELFLQDPTVKFYTLRLFLIDESGKRVECNQEELWCDDPFACKQITFNFTKKYLLERKSIYLPNDTLTLAWEWCFSKGVSEEIVEDEYGCICSEVKISDAKTVNKEQKSLLNRLADNVKSLYDEHIFSDVKLQTDTEVFPAHKFILSASSDVFKAMFLNDMKEKNECCVHIEDLSDDTVSQMLLFLYTTRVEDLTWGRAYHLYKAADKYAITSLKKICSSTLKKNLGLSNACKVLLLSDLHGDEDLKSFVQDYILKNGKEIINSVEWKAMMETNAKLTAETLCRLFK